MEKMFGIISRAMVKLGYDPEEHGSVDDVLRRVLSSEDPTHSLRASKNKPLGSLGHGEFLKKAGEIPEILSLFGLFPYIEHLIENSLAKFEVKQFFSTKVLLAAQGSSSSSDDGLLSDGRSISCWVEIQSKKSPAVWKKKFLVVQYGFVAYYDGQNYSCEQPTRVQLLQNAKITIKHITLHVKTEQYSCTMKLESDHLCHELKDVLLMNSYGVVQGVVAQPSGSRFNPHFRFGAFAPVRENIAAAWYSDGKSYFRDLATCIENAKSEIFIADWMLSPVIFLRVSRLLK